MIEHKSNFLNDAKIIIIIIIIIIHFAIQLYRSIKNHGGLYWSRT